MGSRWGSPDPVLSPTRERSADRTRPTSPDGALGGSAYGSFALGQGLEGLLGSPNTHRPPRWESSDNGLGSSSEPSLLMADRLSCVATVGGASELEVTFQCLLRTAMAWSDVMSRLCLLPGQSSALSTECGHGCRFETLSTPFARANEPDTAAPTTDPRRRWAGWHACVWFCLLKAFAQPKELAYDAMPTTADEHILISGFVIS